MFTTLLIANRGEIACRVAATARRMGIRTVAVYSDADADALHVKACDIAVRLGASEPRDSYLKGDAILEIARQTGAQAIHPGYGFLAENAAFAEACSAAGIVFVGPPPSAIAAMGSKSAAKALMERAGVPLVPGYHGDTQDADFLQAQADAIGYPLLIKASAGGGGKGMRIVAAPEQFRDALLSCQRESAASFGDDTVLLERYLQKPRHIEIQIFSDSLGNYVYLFERDCSVQRRYQKVIEEAPAPGLTPERRHAMGQAAIAAARAVDYIGAGTVEFIVDENGAFYFMEMNTRLQVEHPVTELITGHDLVQWQLHVAAGGALPLTQDELRFQGHAIEARIYAENPERDFLPSTGTLAVLEFPPHAAFADGDVRIDGGVRQGDTISPYYDPMIAKLVVRGQDRDQARARMMQALDEIHSAGLHTNIPFLRRLMADDSFARADLDTGLIERRYDALFPARQAAPDTILALASAAVLSRYALVGEAGPVIDSETGSGIPADPWALNDGWRVSSLFSLNISLQDGDDMRHLELHRENREWTLAIGERRYPFTWSQTACSGPRQTVAVRLNGVRHQAAVVFHEGKVHVFADGGAYSLGTEDPALYGEKEGDSALGGLTAPMPGKIISISVEAGDTVKRGQALLVMEAMKMEHTLHAPADGTVKEVFYEVGDQVADGDELIVLV